MKNKKITHLLSLIGLVLFAAFFAGSDTQKKLPATTEQVKVGNYDFTPPFTDSAKSSKIAFALINPSFAPTFMWYNIDPFKKFCTSMGADFEELVIARGYSIRGPFASQGDMVYSDKSETDLALEPIIDISLDYSNLKCNTVKHYHFGLYGTSYYTYTYTYSGNLIIGGSINLTASETQTMEKLWKKNITLTSQTITIASTKEYNDCSVSTLVADVFGDPGVNNPIVTVLESYYQTIMNTAWKHLDPLEMATLKPQVDKIRAKKTY